MGAGYPIDHFRAPNTRDRFTVPPFRGFPANLARPESDGLPVLLIKSHTLEKQDRFARFCNAFSTALKKTAPTTYIDLFAGPGVLQLDRNDGLFWGSPLIAVQCPHPFHTLAFVERDPNRWEALRQRTRRLACRDETVVIVNGPAEDVLEELFQRVPRKSIAVTVVDPFRIEFSLAAVEKLAQGMPRLDLILLFAEGVDLQRNLRRSLEDPAQGIRFDAVFGSSRWRQLVNLNEPAARNAGRLRDLYLECLRQAGFSRLGNHVAVKNAKGAQVYLLLYASRADRGVQLWNATTRSKQMDFAFG